MAGTHIPMVHVPRLDASSPSESSEYSHVSRDGYITYTSPFRDTSRDTQAVDADLSSTIIAPSVSPSISALPVGDDPSDPKLEAADLLDDSPVPNQPIIPDGKSVLRYLRYRTFATYQRLFSIVTFFNAGFLIWFIIRYNAPTLENCVFAATPAAVNLSIAVLMRTEDFVNLLYLSIRIVPRTLPLRLRRTLAQIYQFGGIHSGAGVATAVWSLIFAIQATRAYIFSNGISPGVISTTFMIFALLFSMVTSAHPVLRRRLHNLFERIHRFAGWAALSLFWILTITLAQDLAILKGVSLGTALFTAAPIYFLLASTVCLILPWLRLKKVVVKTTTPSSHVTRMWFPGKTAGSNATIRLSTSPWVEWHSFAAIPTVKSTSTEEIDPLHAQHTFSILVSSAGDWTRKQISEAQASSSNPKSITDSESSSHTLSCPANSDETVSGTRTYWIRGIPTTGVPEIAHLFHSIILVATGSGIGPVLSAAIACSQGAVPVKTHIIWSTQAPSKTYGAQVLREVYAADPQAVVWDTRERGRPDLIALAWRRWKVRGADAVVVVSNRGVTRRTVLGLNGMDVPAFAPVFDS